MSDVQSKGTQQEQGNRLERAVAAIEAAIVKHNPALKACRHTIDSKKQICVNGVRHELDVYIEYDFGSVKTSFVFECKNRTRPAGKDEVYVLLEKVNAIAAQNGYLVARGFTKSAVAAATQARGRIILLTAVDYDEYNLGEALPRVRMRTPLNPKYNIVLHGNGNHPISGVNVEALPSSFSKFIQDRSQQLLGSHVLSLESSGVIGRKPVIFEHSEKISPIKIQSRLVFSILYRIEYTYVNEEIPSKVIARFDVPGRGKYLELEFEHPQRGLLTVSIGTSSIAAGS